MTAADILTAHLPITRRNVNAVAAQIEKYLTANAARIMAQKTSPAKQDASRRNGLHGGKPRKYELQPGDVVMLRKSVEASRHDEVAIVAVALEDIDGGFKLETPLDGCRYWNTADLKRVLRVKRVVQRTTKKGK